jgi:DNA-binding response OmpR family regulator
MSAGRILVVSPDPPVLISLAALLRHEGYGVLSADDPDDAARLLTSFAPEVLVVDVSPKRAIPDDLFELRRSLRVPLLIIAPSSEEQCLVSADAHVSSPVLVPELLTTIQRLLTRKVPSPLLVNGVERRSPSRPKRGDVRPCPRCGAAMRFEEPEAAPPAWMCRNLACLNAEFVRGRA